jgi:hypothetical protein
MYRQKTLELMLESQNIIPYSEKQDIVGIKTQLNDLYKEIKQYINTSNLGGKYTLFLKQLCDDIYITYRFLGTQQGAMYTLARYTSQGRQQSHSATPRQSEIGHCFVDYDSPPTLSLSKHRMHGSLAVPSTPRIKRQNTNIRGLTTILSESMLADLDEDYVNIKTVNSNLDDNVIANELDNYNYDDEDSKTCYATPSQIETMNEMSNDV